MRASKDELALEMKVDALETRSAEWGDQMVRHIDLPPGTDFTPLLKGMPNDLCQCPHYGYVLNGSIRIRYADGTEELTSAGESYYWPAGHTGWTDEGVVFVEFSNAEEIRPVLEHLGAQLASS